MKIVINKKLEVFKMNSEPYLSVDLSKGLSDSLWKKVELKDK